MTYFKYLPETKFGKCLLKDWIHIPSQYISDQILLDRFHSAGQNEPGHKRRNCGADRKSELGRHKNIMDARVSLGNTFQLLYNTPALQVYHTHGLVPINVCTLQNIEMVCVLWPRDVWHATLCVPDAKLQEMYGCLELCRRQAIADVTQHCGRFFPSLPHISPTDPPALGCHNACPTLYLILSKLQPLFTK